MTPRVELKRDVHTSICGSKTEITIVASKPETAVEYLNDTRRRLAEE